MRGKTRLFAPRVSRTNSRSNGNQPARNAGGKPPPLAANAAALARWLTCASAQRYMTRAKAMLRRTRKGSKRALWQMRARQRAAKKRGVVCFFFEEVVDGAICVRATNHLRAMRKRDDTRHRTLV